MEVLSGRGGAKQQGSLSEVARQAGESYQPGERIRQAGGGKKKLVESDATLLADLEQELANEEQLTITVAHYPPATGKWNKIEHGLFSFISLNWRANPLTSFEVVLELLSHPTTKEGLTVTAIKDSHTYPTGIKVSDEELAAINLSRNPFHGEWNYTTKPQGRA